ncbi:hypothetical protein KI387_030498 [Taxus chinensis]|uniref:Uncharacterized protein n=1 Tax=Taxus chinensis TaxID=29808 RepID=A0AA38CGT6_TAXCH|nr:hypothetical protein KI387_030498 [Taxus chinensis]
MELKTVLFLVLLFICSSSATADEDSGLCDKITCGKGRCKLFDLFIPICECDHGWTQPAIGFPLPFLPCVIPNCSFDATCTPSTAPSSSPAPSPSPSPSPVLPPGKSVLHPCEFALCGEGFCEKTSDYGYKCNCDRGYENLMNMTTGPCIRECSVGADCWELGISVGVGGSGYRTAAPAPGAPTPSPPLHHHQLSPFSPVYDNKGSEKDIPCRIASAILSCLFFLLLGIY